MLVFASVVAVALARSASALPCSGKDCSPPPLPSNLWSFPALNTALSFAAAPSLTIEACFLPDVTVAADSADPIQDRINQHKLFCNMNSASTNQLPTRKRNAITTENAFGVPTTEYEFFYDTGKWFRMPLLNLTAIREADDADPASTERDIDVEFTIDPSNPTDYISLVVATNEHFFDPTVMSATAFKFGVPAFADSGSQGRDDDKCYVTAAPAVTVEVRAANDQDLDQLFPLYGPYFNAHYADGAPEPFTLNSEYYMLVTVASGFRAMVRYRTNVAQFAESDICDQATPIDSSGVALDPDTLPISPLDDLDGEPLTFCTAGGSQTDCQQASFLFSEPDDGGMNWYGIYAGFADINIMAQIPCAVTVATTTAGGVGPTPAPTPAPEPTPAPSVPTPAPTPAPEPTPAPTNSCSDVCPNGYLYDPCRDDGGWEGRYKKVKRGNWNNDDESSTSTSSLVRRRRCGSSDNDSSDESNNAGYSYKSSSDSSSNNNGHDSKWWWWWGKRGYGLQSTSDSTHSSTDPNTESSSNSFSNKWTNSMSGSSSSASGDADSAITSGGGLPSAPVNMNSEGGDPEYTQLCVCPCTCADGSSGVFQLTSSSSDDDVDADGDNGGHLRKRTLSQKLTSDSDSSTDPLTESDSNSVTNSKTDSMSGSGSMSSGGGSGSGSDNDVVTEIEGEEYECVCSSTDRTSDSSEQSSSDKSSGDKTDASDSSASHNSDSSTHRGKDRKHRRYTKIRTKSDRRRW